MKPIKKKMLVSYRMSNSNGLIPATSVTATGDTDESPFYVRNTDPVIVNNIVANNVITDELILNGQSITADETAIFLNSIPYGGGGGGGVNSVTGTAPIQVTGTATNPVVGINLSGIVQTTGNQSITGTKTFFVAPKTTDIPLADDDITNKAYVDTSVDNWSTKPATQDVDMNGKDIDNVVKITGDTSLTLSAPTDVIVDPLFGTFRVTGKSLLMRAIAPAGQDVSDSTLAIETDNDMSLTATDALSITAGTMTINNAVSMTNHKITNVLNPTDPQDVATKSYVDSLPVAAGTLAEVLAEGNDASGQSITGLGGITMSGLVPTITNSSGTLTVAGLLNTNITAAGVTTITGASSVQIGSAGYTSIENVHIENSVISKESGQADLQLHNIAQINNTAANVVIQNAVNGLIVRPNGDVMINTTTPQGKLTVAGAVRMDASGGDGIYMRINGGNGDISMETMDADSNITIATNAATSYVQLSSNKYVNIANGTNGGVSITPVAVDPTPNSTSILDISKVNNKGLLLPAMTSAQMAAILSAGGAPPPDGLTIYNTDQKAICTYNGGAAGQWTKVAYLKFVGGGTAELTESISGATVHSITDIVNLTAGTVKTNLITALDPLLSENIGVEGRLVFPGKLDIETNANNDGTSIHIGTALTNAQAPSCVAIGAGAGNQDQAIQGTAIGNFAGAAGQKSSAIAVGAEAGFQDQGSSAIALGSAAARNTQGNYGVAIGADCARETQGYASVAMGFSAGYFEQGDYAIALGHKAGLTSQPEKSIMINASDLPLNGTNANALYINPIRDAAGPQGLYYDPTTKEVTYAPVGGGTQGPQGAQGATGPQGAPGALPSLAEGQVVFQGAQGLTGSSFFTYKPNEPSVVGQGELIIDGKLTVTGVLDPIAIILTSTLTNPTPDPTALWNSGTALQAGDQGGIVGDETTIIAIGQGAGITNQGAQTVAIGINAGNLNQSYQTVAIGDQCGKSNMTYYAVGVGANALMSGAGAGAIGIGFRAGETNAANESISIGNSVNSDGAAGYGSVSVGPYASRNGSAAYSVNVGWQTGGSLGATDSVHIGNNSGGNGAHSVCVGGATQAPTADSVHVGYNNGTNSGTGSIGIGYRASFNQQGEYAIACGYLAGENSQPARSIILNATGATLDGTTTDSLYVKPIRNATGPQGLFYDPTSGEVTYAPGGGGEPGPQGPQGAQGEPGPQGPQGATGPAVTANTIYVNDGETDIQTAVNNATQATQIVISPGSFGGTTLEINGKQNIALIAPPRGQGTITELASLRGLSLGATSTGSISVANLQIEGLTSLAGSGNNYFTNNDHLSGIIVGAGATGGYFFKDCSISGLVEVPNTFAGVITFAQCNFQGASFALSNPSALQVQFAQCINLPTSRPVNATYGSANSDTSLAITTDTTYLRVNGQVGTAGQVLTSQGSGIPTWTTMVSSVVGSEYISTSTTGSQVSVSSQLTIVDRPAIASIFNNSATTNTGVLNAIVGNSQDWNPSYPNSRTYANQPGGQQNVIYGISCMPTLSTTITAPVSNVSIGFQTGPYPATSVTTDITNRRNVAMGQQAMGNMSVRGSLDSTAIGHLAGFQREGSDFNVFLGSRAGTFANGDYGRNVLIGYEAGVAKAGGGNVSIGFQCTRGGSGFENTSLGFDNTFECNGSDNIYIGNRTAQRINGDRNIIIGSSTGQFGSATSLSNAFIVGHPSNTDYMVGDMVADTFTMTASASFGNIALSNATISPTAGANTGNHLRINLNGTFYKIRLEADA